MGNMVLQHHAVGPHVAEIPPTPHPKKLLRRGPSLWHSQHALSGLGARLGQQGGGGGLAARGEIFMQGVTNLVGEAAEASLAGPSIVESGCFRILSER